MKKRLLLIITMFLLLTNTAYASEMKWELVQGHHNRGLLLEPGVNSSKDTIQNFPRGEYISNGMLEIVNQRNGSIYICVDTLAHTNVDRIKHTVFLDRWDDRKEVWVQVDAWDFERTKEEEGGELSMLTNTLTITGLPVNCYYRARGLHMVEIGDEIEGCATETHGVLITKD